MTQLAQSQRIALYGGTFDPIHFGHLISARSVAEQIDAGRVILIPAARPPHKSSRKMAEASHRLAMTRLAVQGDPLFEVRDLEIHRAGPSYTIDTVTELRKELGPAADLVWIIGSDSLPDLASWYRISELLDTISVVAATRPGTEQSDLSGLQRVIGAERTERLLRNRHVTPMIDISATAIRERVAGGKSIHYLTPEVVVTYIDQHGLYRK